MRKRFERGEAMEVILLLVGLLAFTFTYLLPEADTGKDTGSKTVSPYSYSTPKNQVVSSPTITAGSSYAKSVRLGRGNASYTYQPYEEYISISNQGEKPVKITGWKLKNAKDTRPFDFGGNLKYFSSDEAYIPKAALYISPTGNSIFQDVYLEDGERAIVTTGNPIGARSPYQIVSFKENKCSGYLERSSDYEFTPALSRNCPRPEDEAGVDNLDIKCREFIGRMSSCRTPEFDTRDREGNICTNCVDGKLLTSSCVAFIKAHYNYASCIYNHKDDPDFSGRTWRIFLGRGWEMWASKYEVISLFDEFNRLVDYISY